VQRSPHTLLLPILAGAALLSLLYVYLGPQGGLSLLREQGKTISSQSTSPTGAPVRLKIPKITVDAAIEYVKIAPDGKMDTPKNLDDVAWYEPGVRPGEEGSAVIAGHYGWVKGKGLVFGDLHTLRMGDKIYIEDDTGKVISFVVRESRRYDPEADTEDVFVSNDGKAHLNLITCDGSWNTAQQSYSERLVVFADKEE